MAASLSAFNCGQSAVAAGGMAQHSIASQVRASAKLGLGRSLPRTNLPRHHITQASLPKHECESLHAHGACPILVGACSGAQGFSIYHLLEQACPPRIVLLGKVETHESSFESLRGRRNRRQLRFAKQPQDAEAEQQRCVTAP